MTKEEAQEYAKTMTYTDAINNLMRAKSIPYRKATFIKITELLKALERETKVDRIEYGTDGNQYRLTISNGKEYEQESERDVINRIKQGFGLRPIPDPYKESEE